LIDPAAATVRVHVWDAPVRIIHWLIVVLVATSWWTAENDQLEYHRYSGYVLLGLLVFRLYWGFVGSSTARLGSFIKGPRATLAYLGKLRQRDAAATPGHNPLGAWSVLALFVLMLAQIALGLFAIDVDGIESGPLTQFVSFETGRTLARWHHRLFDVLWWLIVLHVVAALFYLIYKRQNLISAMVTGSLRVTRGAEPVRTAAFWKVVVGAVLAAGIAWFVARGLQL
jgi:cytochrome b